MFSEANSPARNRQKSCFSPTFNGDISEQITKCMMRLSRPAVTGYSLKALGAWCRQVVLYIYKKKQCREFIKHPQYKMNIHLQGHNSAKTQETIFISALPHILSTQNLFRFVLSCSRLPKVSSAYTNLSVFGLVWLTPLLPLWPPSCDLLPSFVAQQHRCRMSGSRSSLGPRGSVF